MKFTKEQAVEKLNQVLTNGGKKPLRMSTRTLESQTETLMALVNDEEMELDAFVEKVKGNLESINSNLEHDQSDFIKQYKKDHPEPNPTPNPDPDPDPNDPMAQVLERLKKIEERNQVLEDEKLISEKVSKVRGYLQDNGVTDREWIDAALQMTTIGKDDDHEAKGKAILDLYKKVENGGSVIVPNAGAPRGDGSGADDPFAAAKNIIKNRL